MRATGVGPKVREGDLLRGTLLEKKTILVVKEEDTKGPVKHATFDIDVEMTF